MIRLIATLLSLMTTFLFQAQDYRGRGDYEMDEEDIISQGNWEHFNFSGTEQFLMLFGVIIFFIGFAASKSSQEKKEGCLYPGMMILGDFRTNCRRNIFVVRILKITIFERLI